MPLDYRSFGGRIGGGTALPMQNLFFTPGNFTATATGTPPTLTNNNNVQVWSFADAATGEVVTSFFLPTTFRSVNVTFYWFNPNAGAGDVRWRVALKKLDAGDLASEAFAVDTSANVTAGAQNAAAPRGHISAFNTTPGPFGSTFSMLISRIGADAGDTLAGAAQLQAVSIDRAG